MTQGFDSIKPLDKDYADFEMFYSLITTSRIELLALCDYKNPLLKPYVLATSSRFSSDNENIEWLEFLSPLSLTSIELSKHPESKWLKVLCESNTLKLLYNSIL